MSAGTLSGIVTAILLVLFVGVWVWAYSSRRREQFNKMARMPLEEDTAGSGSREKDARGRPLKRDAEEHR